jgi:hypothetical protein
MAGSSNEVGALMDWEFYSSDNDVLLDLIYAFNYEESGDSVTDGDGDEIY